MLPESQNMSLLTVECGLFRTGYAFQLLARLKLLLDVEEGVRWLYCKPRRVSGNTAQVCIE
jgi:hypothetical protein